MKKTLSEEVERGREAGPKGGGPYGHFMLTHPETGRSLFVIASDGRDWEEEKLSPPVWEHVSVSAKYGCPNWAEMEWVKRLFWERGEWAIQFHTAVSDHVNIHKNVLHLWAPVGIDLPKPPRECV